MESISIRLVTKQDTVERLLAERVCLKLGRQVKTPQEKLLSQLGIENEIEGNDATIRDVEDLKKVEQKSENTDKVSPVWYKSKVVSRAHAEIWLKDGQVYLRDVGSSSGTFLNNMRLSPPNKTSRPYPIREGDSIRLGVDYQDRKEDMYKAVEIIISVDTTDQLVKLQQEIPLRFKAALFLLLLATNPYAIKKDHDPNQDTSVDCCICICGIGPFQALFIAPCSHCFHYKCIGQVLKESIMFLCPVCRQVANLEASVSMESLTGEQNWKQVSMTSLVDEEMVDQTFSLETNSDNEQTPTTAEDRNSMDIPGKMDIDVS